LEENSSDKTVFVSELSQVMQRIELLSNDIKLEGTRNYLSWSRRTLLNLLVKRLEKYVTGKYTEPKNKEGVK
jgi:gag-polypeptide of LTR copia-type